MTYDPDTGETLPAAMHWENIQMKDEYWGERIADSVWRQLYHHRPAEWALWSDIRTTELFAQWDTDAVVLRSEIWGIGQYRAHEIHSPESLEF